MKLRFFFFLLLISCAGNPVLSHAQKKGRQLADSLFNDIPTLKQDTVKVKYLVNIARIYNNFNYDTALLHAQNGLHIARSAKWKRGQGLCYELMATVYTNKAQYPDALDYSFKSLKMYEECDSRLGMAMIYEKISVIFMYQNNYDDGLKYAIKALEIYTALNDRLRIAAELGDIGNLFWMKHQFDSALAYDFRALDIYKSLGNQNYHVARTWGNIGMTYGDAGNYKKALQYHFMSLDEYKKIGNIPRSVGITYSNIGLAYLKNAQDTTVPQKERITLLHKALAYKDTGISVDIKMGNLFEQLDNRKDITTIYELLGDYKSAYENYKAYIIIRDSVFSTENKVKIAKAASKYELDLAALTIAKQRNEKWFLISGTLLLCVIGILFINRQKLEHKKLEAEKKSTEAELDAATRMLESFRQSVIEKNNIIERITAEMAQMKEGELQKIDDETVARLEKTILLTDEQWEEFRVLFEKVHKGFFKRVKEKMPDLTPAELRFVALSKLKLGPKEMAAMLGISSNSIRNYRHRLRRKLGLGEEASIEDIADAI